MSNYILKTLMIFLAILGWSKTYSQDSISEYELPQVNILNRDLSSILDSFLLKEKKCIYYNDRLIIFITAQKLKDERYYFSIASSNDSNSIKTIGVKGYSYVGSHLIAFRGDSMSTLLSFTNNLKKFKESNKPHLGVAHDDSFSMAEYSYYYKKKKFKQGGKSFCGDSAK